MEVNDDKSVTLEIIYGMEVDDPFMDEEESWDDEESDSEVSVDDYKFLESKGFKVQ